MLVLRKSVLPSHISDMEPEVQASVMDYLNDITGEGKTTGNLPTPTQTKHDITSIWYPQQADYIGTDKPSVPHAKVLDNAVNGEGSRRRLGYGGLVGTNSRSRNDRYSLEGPLTTTRSRGLAHPATVDNWERDIAYRRANMPRRAYSTSDDTQQQKIMQQFARMALLAGMPEDTPIVYGPHDPRVNDKRAFKLHEIASGKHFDTPFGTTTLKSLFRKSRYAMSKRPIQAKKFYYHNGDWRGTKDENAYHELFHDEGRCDSPDCVHGTVHRFGGGRISLVTGGESKPGISDRAIKNTARWMLEQGFNPAHKVSYMDFMRGEPGKAETLNELATGRKASPEPAPAPAPSPGQPTVVFKYRREGD